MVNSKTAPLIVARGLTKVYHLGSNEVVGIRGVDLAIERGACVALKGNSGSGKSTLLALLGGLDQPTRGSLTVDGQDLQRASPGRLNHYRREVVGMIFQSFNLLPTLTVIENVCLPGLLAGRARDEVEDSARKRLEWLGLGDRLRHYPGQLSGGEMQRTAIARALINSPPLILADEPTGNLDSRNGEKVISLLAQLNETIESTVIIATHSTLADPYATLQMCLSDGAVIETSACSI